ncbi:hypothetical protein [Desulfobulbus sp.]|uniref:hypothetical protein n=1 Tax=Desulfobulbus sp. TaxID=895 RepID=UPI0027B8A6B4|nr:hypothetical protein [Desulfobulbus sp.]
MAPFLTSEEVQGILGINEESLVFYIHDKQLTAFDRSYKPVDLSNNEKIFIEIQKLCEPVIAKNVLIRKAKINPYVQDPCFDTTEIRGDKKYCRIRVIKDGDWVNLPDLYKILSNAGPKDNWPVIAIPENQYFAIKAGWNQDRVCDVYISSLFKKSEVDEIQLKEGKQDIAEITNKREEEIGVSERETFLKIILLLSYSLALELKGDPDVDLLNKKGAKKISPENLSSFLKKQALSMFRQQINPTYRIGKTKLGEILQEAEEKLSPDIYLFLEPEK